MTRVNELPLVAPADGQSIPVDDGVAGGRVLMSDLRASLASALFAWNGVDLSEFDTGNPIQCEDDLGNESGSASAAVELDDWDQPVIRITTVSLRGVWLLPLLEASALAAAFPRGVVIEVVFGACSTTSIIPMFGVVSDDEGGDAEGLLFELLLGSASSRLRGILADRLHTTDVLGTDTPGAMDLEAMNAGVRVRLELWMSEDVADPDGGPADTVLGYRARVEVDSQDGHKRGANATGNTGYINLSTATGEPMDKIAIGLSTGIAVSGTLDVLDLRVYPHPLGRS